MYLQNNSYSGFRQYAPAYSPLERVVSSSYSESSFIPAENYKPNSSVVSQSYKSIITESYFFDPELFLNPDRPATQFVGEAGEVIDFVKQAFKLTTGNDFPKDITIQLCSREELMQFHSPFGAWSPGILGFAVNRKNRGISNIFVLKNNLDVLLLTIGHEIGHVLKPALADARSEEAKAFAFEIAWMKAIVESNVAGLNKSFSVRPAENGLHNVAFDSVMKELNEGKEAILLYLELCGLC